MILGVRWSGEVTWCTFIDDAQQPSALAIIQTELPKCSHHRSEPHHQQIRHVIGNNGGCSFLPSAFAIVSLDLSLLPATG